MTNMAALRYFIHIPSVNQFLAYVYEHVHVFKKGKCIFGILSFWGEFFLWKYLCIWTTVSASWNPLVICQLLNNTSQIIQLRHWQTNHCSPYICEPFCVVNILLLLYKPKRYLLLLNAITLAVKVPFLNLNP